MKTDNRTPNLEIVSKAALTLLAAWVLIRAEIDLVEILQVNAARLGRYAFLGTVTLILFGLACLALFALFALALWRRGRLARIEKRLISWRMRLGGWRWLLIGLILLLPLLVMQATPVGTYLTGGALRLLLLIAMGFFSGALLTRSEESLVKAPELTAGFLLVASLFTLGRNFANVSGYPFSLSWSEGNRFWDYSILFGQRLYEFPPGERIFAFIDLGRQALWGLPFLFADISIWQLRLWNGILFTLPYILFGWVVFRRNADNRTIWLLSGLWALVFLNQGPIYTPLVLCAILVALAWRSPIWLALPLVVVAGYYAQLTRFTWMFAPAIWAGLVYLGDTSPESATASLSARRVGLAAAIVIAGLVGGFFLPRLPGTNQVFNPAQVAGETTGEAPDIVSVEGVASLVSRQSLIWERLLPNPTYGLGIILALVLASGPILLYLAYLLKTRRWQLDWLGGLAVFGGLLIFLVVGLVISVKIGGGNNLHNLDMFLLAVVFVSALAWKKGGYRTLIQLDREPLWAQALWVVMMILFAYQPLTGTQPLKMAPRNIAQDALDQIRAEVERAQAAGEVLFLDQRQLLTFGYIRDVPLVDDYEKKYLMDQAMSNNADYFQGFYEDLARQRFALIVSEPLKVNLKGSEYSFGEENDVWVKWVSKPLLCYYEPIETFKRVRVELLVPRANPQDCP
jgi:hypothetical protein